MTQTKTDKDPPAGGEQPTDAERMAALEAENEQLRAQVKTLGDVQADAEGREGRQAAAEAEKARLQAEYRERAKSAAVRAAAEALGIDGAVAVDLYGGQFKAEGPEGAVVVTPSPKEFLEQQLRDNPRLKRAQENRQQEQEDRATVAAPDAEGDPVKLQAALDRDVMKRAAYLKKHGQEKTFELLRRARAAGYTGQIA